MGRSESTVKSFEISKRLVFEAWEKVRVNDGAPGVDAVSVAQFGSDERNNLYKLWNRMSAGSYFPAPVRAVEIPKDHGLGVRVLGVPNVVDRIAQTAAAMLLEEKLEPIFHPDSYGYRPGRSAGLAFGPTHSSAEASVIEGERRGRTIRGKFVRATSKSGRDRVSEPKSKVKPFSISKHLVWEAYQRVKANKGAPGVDGCSIEDFEADLKNNLYRIWNRMSSGSYFPPPVKAVEIPKPHGGVRVLGVPTAAA